MQDSGQCQQRGEETKWTRVLQCQIGVEVEEEGKSQEEGREVERNEVGTEDEVKEDKWMQRREERIKKKR